MEVDELPCGQYSSHRGLIWCIIIIVIVSLLVEVGFLALFGYSCFIKDRCMVPYFFGAGRFMFPFVITAGTTEQYCSMNGAPVNCSEINIKRLAR